MNQNEIMNVAADTGSLMLLGGAESFRIEETVEHVGKSLGLELSCYVTLTAVFVSADDLPLTKVVKPKLSGFNLQTVDEVNSISRKLESKEITPEEYKKEINNIHHYVKDYSKWSQYLAAGLVSMAPVFINQVKMIDYPIMAIFGIFGFMIYKFISKYSETPYVAEFMGGLLVAIFSIILNQFELVDHYQLIMVGALMPLVPGTAITTSIREIVSGHMLSGIVRSLNAIISLSSIAAGAIVGLEMIEHLFN
ncbi:threonine/serine exporter family protein [Lactobacillus sp. S2-2]|uniref:threonine/serine ThrE exporter family protein n=1 Tax=Lactobacillus sp. S2-2 TaxID=2692917 RepID=UPI001F344B91|nr:threonine/serine exporter family protein [Lactobacillus sp. S2-2]MCF6515479.1 threonine/serine exporter family protein [Lactobacillus sp. S2-2]